jgi:hypothetical protein
MLDFLPNTLTPIAKLPQIVALFADYPWLTTLSGHFVFLLSKAPGSLRLIVLLGTPTDCHVSGSPSTFASFLSNGGQAGPM